MRPPPRSCAGGARADTRAQRGRPPSRGGRETEGMASVGEMPDRVLTRPRRVGHKGAAHIEPGNTLASFDAALRHGVDMIELDVLPEHRDGRGELLVAHDYEDMRSRPRVHLQEALEHLNG